MRVSKLFASVSAAAVSLMAVVAIVIAAPAASAAPYQGGNYGAFQNEGRYPTSALCGTFSVVQRGSLRTTYSSLDWIYYYSPRCGAFGRIENVHLGWSASAVVEVHRSNSGAPVSNGYVGETIDPGLNFAYTKIANNLSGRVAQVRAVLRDQDSSASVGSIWF